VIGRDPADVIREALNLHKSMHLSGEGQTARSVTAWSDALAALEDMQQRQSEPRTEQEHRWRNEVRRCQIERDAAEAALADANQELAARPTLDEAMANVNYWKDRATYSERRADDYADTLRDFAVHGTRYDCNPTVMVHGDNEAWMKSHQWWVDRAEGMDRAVRSRARAALDRHTTPAPTEGGDET
jgi:hypothetical protein